MLAKFGRVVAYDSDKGCSRDMLDDRFLLYEIETYRTIEVFQIQILVEMLYGASNIIDLAHHVVMTWADEKFGSTLELPLNLTGLG